ncbi:MAG: Molybdenum cofactor guanylyltransferase [Phycisphaerae bacterium]|nr:Molybdenum cofactor guanylyltransferase [Phycisphaerae bacterium]
MILDGLGPDTGHETAANPQPSLSRSPQRKRAMLDDLPVLGVCGFSGAGKTTLIEAVLPALRVRGLRVTVVKHDAHGIDIDRAGKDSDRFFRAGADVLLQGPGQQVLRSHSDGSPPLHAALVELCDRHDLVLVEGHKGTPIEKVWLVGPEGDPPPIGVSGVIATLARDTDRPAALLCLLDDWLRRRWLAAPVRACVLIGGQSSRMGRPKHLIERDGRTWLARTVDVLRPLACEVVIVGRGDLPQSHAHLPRLPDAPGVAGPMAGVLAAMRWAPRSSWLVVACDHPDLSPSAVEWLLSTREPGVWATVPQAADGHVEPLLAHYDFRARPIIEELARRGRSALRRVSEHPKARVIPPPPSLADAWADANTPADLAGGMIRPALSSPAR